jgi:hypothetical protein
MRGSPIPDATCGLDRQPDPASRRRHRLQTSASNGPECPRSYFIQTPVTSSARISFIGTSTFIVLLSALHVLKPEIDPSWRFISEYAIGAFGWMMSLAFMAFATGFAALFAALRPSLSGIAGRVGGGALLISAAGLVLAAIFTTDPVTIASGEATTRGKLHSFGGALGLAIPFAVGFVSWRLVKDARWAHVRVAVLVSAFVAILAFLVAFISLAMMMTASQGKFGPDVPVGWPNRLEVTAYAAWLLTVAWQAMRLGAAGARNEG